MKYFIFYGLNQKQIHRRTCQLILKNNRLHVGSIKYNLRFARFIKYKADNELSQYKNKIINIYE